MNTLKTELDNYSTQSVRELNTKLGFAKRPLIAVSKLLMGPESRLIKPDHQLNAGDVEQKIMHLFLQSDGCYSFVGTLWDAGSTEGDDFTIAVAFFLPGKVSVVWHHEGHANHKEDTSWEIDGLEPRVRDNWDDYQTAGASWHLHSEFNTFENIVNDIKDFFKDIGQGIYDGFKGLGDALCGKDGCKPKKPVGSKPNITVKAQGGMNFLVEGTLFLPNNNVFIHIGDDKAHPIAGPFQCQSDNLGKISNLVHQNCNTGLNINFFANDSRGDPTDATGNLTSNNFPVKCA